MGVEATNRMVVVGIVRLVVLWTTWCGRRFERDVDLNLRSIAQHFHLDDITRLGGAQLGHHDSGRVERLSVPRE